MSQWQRILAALALLGATLVAHCEAPSKASPPVQEPSRYEQVIRLGLPFIPGATPAWYVPGGRDRALLLQHLLDEERRFFAQSVDADVRLSVVVLDPERWAEVEPELPYGMPSISDEPRVAMMPLNWDGVSFLPPADPQHMDPVVAARARRDKLNWPAIIHTGGDLIITHEFGHALASMMGTDTPVNWLNELIASYATYAYVKGVRPDLVESLELFYIYTTAFPHEHSSLHYLDAHYVEIAARAPANYGWYQGTLFMRIMSVYQREGVAFLKNLQADVRSHGRFLERDTLDRLEAISPGWKSWASGLEAQERVSSQR